MFKMSENVVNLQNHLIPLTLIIECLKIFQKVETFITRAVESWNVEIAVEEPKLTVQRDIFQGNTLSTEIFYSNESIILHTKKTQRRRLIYKF